MTGSGRGGTSDVKMLNWIGPSRLPGETSASTLNISEWEPFMKTCNDLSDRLFRIIFTRKTGKLHPCNLNTRLSCQTLLNVFSTSSRALADVLLTDLFRLMVLVTLTS